jgi:hypothetical protein
MLGQAWLQGVRAPAMAATSALFPWVTKAQEPVEPAEITNQTHPYCALIEIRAASALHSSMRWAVSLVG